MGHEYIEWWGLKRQFHQVHPFDQSRLLYTNVSRIWSRNTFSSFVRRGLAHSKAGRGGRIPIQRCNSMYGTAHEKNNVSRCKTNGNTPRKQEGNFSSQEDSLPRWYVTEPSTTSGTYYYIRFIFTLLGSVKIVLSTAARDETNF